MATVKYYIHFISDHKAMVWKTRVFLMEDKLIQNILVKTRSKNGDKSKTNVAA